MSRHLPDKQKPCSDDPDACIHSFFFRSSVITDNDTFTEMLKPKFCKFFPFSVDPFSEGALYHCRGKKFSGSL